MTSTERKDGDGLPFPGEGTLFELQTEAATARPKASDWAELVALLRWSVELQKRGVENPELPPGMTAPHKAIHAVINFLMKQDCVMKHGAAQPLIELQTAIVDLADGRVSPMFKPRVRPIGHPGKGKVEALRMGMAARAMTELMEGGQTEAAAAKEVGAALGLSPAKVQNWRDQLNLGKGPGAPQEAVDHYRAPLPAWSGSTGIERGRRTPQSHEGAAARSLTEIAQTPIYLRPFFRVWLPHDAHNAR